MKVNMFQAESEVLILANRAHYRPEARPARITARESGPNRKEIFIGIVHFCDVINEQDGKYIVYKEPRKGMVRADAREMIRMLG